MTTLPKKRSKRKSLTAKKKLAAVADDAKEEERNWPLVRLKPFNCDLYHVMTDQGFKFQRCYDNSPIGSFEDQDIFGPCDWYCSPIKNGWYFIVVDRPGKSPIIQYFEK